ncbi:hypothetical protein BZA05DRAFT_436038, partial [Tricharina praecox]|uniref:uncharacterized protein n=1 Tax=Tricharina praecox TaxID=43433 RepID=UPI00221ED6B4
FPPSSRVLVAAAVANRCSALCWPLPVLRCPHCGAIVHTRTNPVLGRCARAHNGPDSAILRRPPFLWQ